MRPVRLLPTLPLVAALTGAAGPRGVDATIPAPYFSTQAQAPSRETTPPGYTTAPLPNADSYAPTTRASPDTAFTPGFFSRRDQYRGEGLSAGSSAQIEQDRRAKPGAGFSLRMPLQ